MSDCGFMQYAQLGLTPELSDHAQRQDGLAFRINVHRCPWFAPVILVRPRAHDVVRGNRRSAG
jgi:hypothetical protein